MGELRPGYSIAIWGERLLETWPTPEDAQARLRTLGRRHRPRTLLHLSPTGSVLGLVNQPPGAADRKELWADIKRRRRAAAGDAHA